MTGLHVLSYWITSQTEPAAGPLGGIAQLFPLIVVFGVFYFLLIRPASKQRKEHQQLLQALSKGDEVVTSGGIYGKLVSIEDNGVVTLEIADKVKIRMMRDRIAGRWAPTAQPTAQK
ncbi:MAG: preprotein translocase subunit YajC [Myxococcota bacterium]